MRQVLIIVLFLGACMQPAAQIFASEDRPDFFAHEPVGNWSRRPSEQAVRAHVDHLLRFLKSQKKASEPIDLANLLEAGFSFAKTRSESSDRVQENSAALLAAGTIAGAPEIGRLAGYKPDPEVRKKIDRQGARIRLSGRRDLAQHFCVSAAFAAVSNETLSNFIGQLKEQTDAAGGSGFSFADLAADQAGSRLGRLATQNDALAARIQQELSRKHPSKDYMPSVAGLPEGISAETLQRDYGGIGGPGYQRWRKEIEVRLDQCRLFREARVDSSSPDAS